MHSYSFIEGPQDWMFRYLQCCSGTANFWDLKRPYQEIESFSKKSPFENGAAVPWYNSDTPRVTQISFVLLIHPHITKFLGSITVVDG